MSKEQFEHLKSTLVKIHELTPMLENLELKDNEKDESIKIYNQKQVNIITKKLDKIKRSMTTKDEKMNKNNSLISEFREKVNDLEYKGQKIQLETYGDMDWRESKRQHDAEIEKLMEKKVKKDEEDDEYLPPLYGGLVGMTFLLIGSFLGYKIANHLFPTGVSFGDLIGNPPFGSAFFWITCCFIPFLITGIGVFTEEWMSQKYNIKIDLKINSTVTEYNNSTQGKLLTEIEDEIKNYNNKISDLKSANKGLNGLSKQKANLENELATANNNLAKIDKEEKRILKMKTDLNKEIESLFDEIKHLIPHSEKF